MTTPLERFHEQWSVARPQYEQLLRWAQRRIQKATREIGFPCEISGRAKEIDSFLKKCVTKGYGDPMTEMVDKAGVRVVLGWPGGRDSVEQVVTALFKVAKTDDHWTADEQIFGYAAVHYDVELTSGPYKGMNFEIQVHSPGQHLWAAATHKLSYKGATSPDPRLKRRIHRLAALLEIFDQDIESVRAMILSDPAYKGAYALSVLARHYYRLTGRPYDDALSVFVLDALGALIPDAATDRFANEMETWITANDSRLKSIFNQYKEDYRHLLLFQPESLFLFKQLSEDRFKLEAEWVAKGLSEELLVPLGSIWGVQVSGES